MKTIDLNEFYEELGRRIRENRLKAQISQEAFAQALELTRGSIVNIEKGRQRPMIHTLLIISEVLKVNIGELIPGVEKKSHSEKDIFDWIDFELVQTSEFTIDQSTQKAIKDFKNSLKNV